MYQVPVHHRKRLQGCGGGDASLAWLAERQSVERGHHRKRQRAALEDVDGPPAGVFVFLVRLPHEAARTAVASEVGQVVGERRENARASPLLIQTTADEQNVVADRFGFQTPPAKTP